MRVRFITAAENQAMATIRINLMGQLLAGAALQERTYAERSAMLDLAADLADDICARAYRCDLDAEDSAQRFECDRAVKAALAAQGEEATK